MSIANALNNAISGLSVASRGTEVVSTNLANAMTPGYARRELMISPRQMSSNGGGVQVDGVTRIVSDTVLADLRSANASVGRSSVNVRFYRKLEAAIGQPMDVNSLTAAISRVETALISASSRPDSEVRLLAVIDAADQLAQKINSASASIDDAQAEADRAISKQIDTLSGDLKQLAQLNRQVIVTKANGRDSSSVEDARRIVIDRISNIVPVRVLPRENGKLALYTMGGAVLLDGKSPSRIQFKPDEAPSAPTGSSGPTFRKLWINDKPASNAQYEMFSGGTLTELFKVRDHHTVQAKEGIDRIARAFHDRFAQSDVDPTVPPGGSGLFSDRSGAFDPANSHGIAARLRVNPMLDPAQGGQLRRIRDGINSATPKDVGDGTILTAMSKVIKAVNPSAADGSDDRLSLAGFASRFLSGASAGRVTHEDRHTHDKAVQSSLNDTLLAEGVNSDREMQMMLQLEKTYAANAKVIQAIDRMLDQILRI